MLLHQRIINNKKLTENNIHEYHKNALYSTDRTSYPINVTISYTKDNYTSVERYYDIMYSEVDKFCYDLLAFINRPDAILRRIENTIDADYISSGHIYYYYNVPSGTYLDEKENITIDAPSSKAAYSMAIPITTIGSGNIDVSVSGETEYVHGNLELTGTQAGELLENAILLDAQNGNIGRVRPYNPGYKNKINVNIEFSSRIPYYTAENTLDYYNHQYIYMEDITEDAVYTVAALKELGVDLEALSVNAIDRNSR